MNSLGRPHQLSLGLDIGRVLSRYGRGDRWQNISGTCDDGAYVFWVLFMLTCRPDQLALISRTNAGVKFKRDGSPTWVTSFCQAIGLEEMGFLSKRSMFVATAATKVHWQGILVSMCSSTTTWSALCRSIANAPESSACTTTTAIQGHIQTLTAGGACRMAWSSSSCMTGVAWQEVSSSGAAPTTTCGMKSGGAVRPGCHIRRGH